MERDCPGGLAEGLLTVTSMLLGLAHSPGAGVKVRIWVPEPAVAGLKVLLVTPGPDQEPATPSCRVGRFTGGSLPQNGP